LPNRVDPTPGSRLGDGRLGTPGRIPNVPGLNNNQLNRNLNQLDRGLNQADRNLNRSLNNLAGQRSANFRPGFNNFPTAARIGNRNINFAANNYRPSYSRYGWYNGFWGNSGNRYWGNGAGWGFGSGRLGYGRFGNGWGFPGYGYRSGFGYVPLGWGLGGWGLGSLLYGSGYLPYSNPYWGANYGGVGIYDYSQPIPVAYTTTTIIDTPVVDGAPASGLDGAIDAFMAGDYNAALDLVDKAIERTPSDAVLHEFRALVLFARRDFQQAAATIHSVLAVGPGWDWTTLSSLYNDIDVYTGQLRALEAYTVDHPDDAGSALLLAYHYLSAGHPKHARRELETVVRLQPNDRVAAELLKMVSTEPQDGAADSSGNRLPAAPVPDAANPQTAQSPQASSGEGAEPSQFPATGPAVDAAVIAGNWSATRPDGSQFQLQLTPDSKFTWTFQNKESPAQSFEGTYTLSGNVLALERKEGGSMVAELTEAGPQKFHFQLYGTQDDPGLDFNKR
jgi:tetratricopeptide (TPR) repeat protein